MEKYLLSVLKTRTTNANRVSIGFNMWPSISRITIQELTTETALTVCYVVCLVHVNFELETNVLQLTVHKLRDYQSTDRKSETLTMNVYVMIFRLCLGFPQTDSLINNQPLFTLKTQFTF